jgi:DGQHR domain-containing protein
MQNFIRLAAVRGIQGGKAFYLAGMPFATSVRLLRTDRRSIIRRGINRTRVNRFVEYLLAPGPGHVVPPVHVSVEGELRFEAHRDTREAGAIEIELAADLRIVDGLSRVAAIAKAIELRPGLSRETLPVCFHVALSEEASASMFDNLNRRASKPPALRT